MGVASGCGCKEVYRFPHITYPYSSCSSIPTFCSLHYKFKPDVRMQSKNAIAIVYTMAHRHYARYMYMYV